LPRLLDDILRDRPFGRAEFYEDRQVMNYVGGGVDIEILERGRTARFKVVHADPSIRDFDEQMMRERKAAKARLPPSISAPPAAKS
jgi:hypothetical protein